MQPSPALHRSHSSPRSITPRQHPATLCTDTAEALVGSIDTGHGKPVTLNDDPATQLAAINNATTGAIMDLSVASTAPLKNWEGLAGISDYPVMQPSPAASSYS